MSISKFIPLLAFISIFSLFQFSPASAITNVTGYTFSSHDVDITVNQNNSFDITETITADFTTPHHGIYVSLPLFNTLPRADGTKSTNHARITNVSASENYTTDTENNNYIIKIGSPDYTVTGEHTYTVKYNYNIGRDPLNDKDELYFNIISNNWETSTDHVNFKITMPAEFDASTLGFTSGPTGSTLNNISYAVDGNTISGSYNGTLKPYEAITVRMELPKVILSLHLPVTIL